MLETVDWINFSFSKLFFKYVHTLLFILPTNKQKTNSRMIIFIVKTLFAKNAVKKISDGCHFIYICCKFLPSLFPLAFHSESSSCLAGLYTIKPERLAYITHLTVSPFVLLQQCTTC